MNDEILAVIKRGQPRNQEVGDWERDEQGVLHITVSKMPVLSEWAVAIHELIEVLRCEQDEITDAQVTQFDAQFLEECNAGKHTLKAESGDDPRAPYREQHRDATSVERYVCAVLGLSWSEHEKAVQEAGG